MDWGTALVAIIVALIAGPIGYYGARWQARHALAQWRRERLLEFCADLLAAGIALLDKAFDIENKEDTTFPDELNQRFRQALEGVLLLTDELSTLAFDYVEAVNAVLKHAYSAAPDANDGKEKRAAASRLAGRLTVDAHFELLDLRRRPSQWQMFRSAIERYVRNELAGRQATPTATTNSADAGRDSTGTT